MVERASAMQQVAGSIPAQVWRLLSVIRVGPYRRVTGSQSSNIHCICCYFMGRQVVRSRLTVILDIKELATPTLVRTQLVVHIFPPTGDGMCRCCQKSLDVSRRWH